MRFSGAVGGRGGRLCVTSEKILLWKKGTAGAAVPTRFPLPHRSLFYVPAGDSYDGICRSQFGGAVSCGEVTLFSGEQGDVVVFPDYGEDFFAMRAFVDLQANEKREGLAGIFYGNVRDGFFAFTVGLIVDFKFYFGQLRKRGVVGKGIGWGHPPGGFCPVDSFRFGGEPVEIRSDEVA